MKYSDIARMQVLDAQLKRLDFERRVLELEKADLAAKCDHTHGQDGSAMEADEEDDEIDVCSICGERDPL